jgi:hypothetical protein
MFGRKKIAELREEIRLDNICLDLANGRIDLLLVDIEKLQEELRQANEAMDLLSSQPVIPEPITDVSTDVFTDVLAWISGEPKDTGWYFVAIKPFNPLADIQTTALFYNPAARCRWMRGEKGNAERFEREIIAYMEVPNYEK